ncbi:MAG: site-2 protease family protein [Oscillospiraceae bacterium]|nr:site-2 protease family protein [Oscillospiraceae bacterium]
MNSTAGYLISWLTGDASVIEVLMSVFATLTVIFICSPVHECAHALVAKLCGDDTAERMGRVTLNPFAHIDLVGAILIFLCHLGYAKPVPVDLVRCRKVPMRVANLLISIAGPLSNFVMAFILLIPYKIFYVQYVEAFYDPMMAERADVLYWLSMVFYIAAQINVSIMLFNLIPVPPLDGYRVLDTFLSPKAERFIDRNARFFQIGLLVLVLSPILQYPLSFAVRGIMNFLQLPLFFIG